MVICHIDTLIAFDVYLILEPYLQSLIHSGGMRHEQVVADYVAPGAVPLPHFLADWLQGKDRGLLLNSQLL